MGRGAGRDGLGGVEAADEEDGEEAGGAEGEAGIDGEGAEAEVDGVGAGCEDDAAGGAVDLVNGGFAAIDEGQPAGVVGIGEDEDAAAAGFDGEGSTVSAPARVADGVASAGFERREGGRGDDLAAEIDIP